MLCKFKGIGGTLKLFEPEYSGNSIHGLKVLEADTPLLPTEMLIKEEAHLNPPSNDLLSAEKSIRSFLMAW